MESEKKSMQAWVNDGISYFALKRTGILTRELRGLHYDRKSQQVGYIDQTRFSPGSVDLLILGREHYREENRSFPIQSRGELRKILQLENKANETEVMLYKIGRYIDGKRKVVTWSCSKETFRRWGVKPTLVIPESLLLLSLRSEELIILTRESNVLWFYNNQGKYFSAEKKGLITSAQMFKASAGLAETIAQREVTDDEYLPILTRQLIPVLTNNLMGLITNLRQLQSINWGQYAKYCGLTATALFAAYLSVTSIYLNLRLSSAVATSDALSSETDSVFILKQQLTDNEVRMQQLSEVSSLEGASSVIWRLLSPLMQRGVTITKLNYLPDGRIIFNGSANKDTEVLTFLNNDNQVESPKLSTGTRTVEGRDYFSIVFKIRESQ